jgi:arylsulfatase A-like enzyme
MCTASIEQVWRARETGNLMFAKMTRRTRISIAVLSALILFIVLYSPTMIGNLKRSIIYCEHGYACNGCNLILISVDTLRADHVGLYTDMSIESPTPNLDAFFKNGTVFERASASSPCTYPSVLQFLTGSFDFSPKRMRLAEILKRGGYRSAAVVSQHMFKETASAGDEYKRGFDIFDIQNKSEKDAYGFSTRSAAQVTSRTLSWLRENSRKGPFFVWVHYFDPHDPYFPAQKFRTQAAKGTRIADGDRRKWLIAEQNNPQSIARRARIRAEFKNVTAYPFKLFGHIFSHEETTILKDLYRGEVSYVDDQIAHLFSFLKGADLLKNSVIMLVSDHGERLGENNVWDHCLSLHQREIHVPLMLSVRGTRWKNRATVAELVSTLDIVPTLLNLLGFPVPEGVFDGRNLNATDTRGTVFSMWQNQTVACAGKGKLYAAHGVFRKAQITGPSEESAWQPISALHLNTALGAALTRFNAQYRTTLESYEDVVTQLKSLGYIE